MFFYEIMKQMSKNASVTIIKCGRIRFWYIPHLCCGVVALQHTGKPLWILCPRTQSQLNATSLVRGHLVRNSAPYQTGLTCVTSYLGTHPWAHSSMSQLDIHEGLERSLKKKRPMKHMVSNTDWKSGIWHNYLGLLSLRYVLLTLGTILPEGCLFSWCLHSGDRGKMRTLFLIRCHPHIYQPILNILWWHMNSMCI